MSMSIQSMANRSLEDNYRKISSGMRINSAKDDAAGLAIMDKLESQINALDQGSDNSADMKNALQTAEGGLSSISDNLQRVRELSIQAQSGIMEDSDKALIQNEISQLLEGVRGFSKSTEFNKMPILDGSFTDKNMAAYPNGSGMTINIKDTSLEDLGLANYDVTRPSFDISTIDKAIDMVDSNRSSIGAQQNGIDYIMSANSRTSESLSEARSRIGDTDMAKAVMELNKGRVLEQASILMAKKQMENKKNKIDLLS